MFTGADLDAGAVADVQHADVGRRAAIDEVHDPEVRSGLHAADPVQHREVEPAIGAFVQVDDGRRRADDVAADPVDPEDRPEAGELAGLGEREHAQVEAADAAVLAGQRRHADAVHARIVRGPQPRRGELEGRVGMSGGSREERHQNEPQTHRNPPALLRPSIRVE